MKKIIGTVAVSALAALVLGAVSCKSAPALPEFGVIEKNQTVRSGQNALELDYRLQYISKYGDGEVMRRIQAAQLADFFGSEYVRATPAESAQAFEQAMSARYLADTSGFGWSGYTKLNSRCEMSGRRIVSFTVERSEYTGGAHGLDETHCYNYDLRTGERLTLGSIFTAEGQAALPGAIRAAILKNNGKATWEELLASTCYFAESEVKATDNFRLTPDTITFIFNPYDIACYAQGGSKVSLPLGGLAGFKKEMIVK